MPAIFAKLPQLPVLSVVGFVVRKFLKNDLMIWLCVIVLCYERLDLNIHFVYR